MPTELLTIYYNGHFTQMCYPDEIESVLNKYGLPMEDITIVQYPAGTVVAPFNIADDKSLTILEEVPTPPVDAPADDPSTFGVEMTLSPFRKVLKEILDTSEGKKFTKKIKENNKKLLDAGLAIIPIEPELYEITAPIVYTIVATVTPTILADGGTVLQDYSKGWLDKLNPKLWEKRNDSTLV